MEQRTVKRSHIEVKVTGEQTEASDTSYTVTAVSLSNPNYTLPAKNTVNFTIVKAKENDQAGNKETGGRNTNIKKITLKAKSGSVKKGKVKIYVFAQNGSYATVMIKVK